MPSKDDPRRAEHCDGKRKDLPRASDLTGSDPDFTGKLTTDEYIREVRGEDMHSKLSDAEIVCSFMEPKPCDMPPGSKWWCPPYVKWWRAGIWIDNSVDWHPRDLTLNELHLVEKRLTSEQWREYENEMLRVTPYNMLTHINQVLINASATQKIAALAEVLRSEVEKQQ